MVIDFDKKPEWFTFLVSAYPGCPGNWLNGCSSSSEYCQNRSISDTRASLLKKYDRYYLQGGY